MAQLQRNQIRNKRSKISQDIDSFNEITRYNFNNKIFEFPIERSKTAKLTLKSNKIKQRHQNDINR